MFPFTINKKVIALVLLASTTFSSCRKLVEIGPPTTQVGLDQAFASDATATSAVLGIYNASATRDALFPLSEMPGLSANELQNNVSSPAFDEFKTNSIAITNSVVQQVLWGYPYSTLNQANTMLNGITRSTTLSSSVKNQLTGEIKVWRAFTLFYLVNMFGDVPLPITDDPIKNATLARAPATEVWVQIIKDLTEAQTVLTDAYPAALRTRINRQTANALLARVYLYQKQWANAEAAANAVINSGLYSLNKNLNTTFSNSSNEVIWQLATLNGISTYMNNRDANGGSYTATPGSVPAVTLTDTLYNSMEPGDLRKANWIAATDIGSKNYKVITKYKITSLPAGASTGNEFNVMLRLAEQYLVRAEARAQQGNLAGAIADVDTIRSRAGLPMLDNSVTQPNLLLAVEQERKAELFGEWGNRWFDLKRTPSTSGGGKTRADDVIGGMRPATWASTDILYPIPDAQRVANPALTQNQGY
ncbi:RagB/SusD family nutrient uptake outer membrane protein [Chitinophaga polysaccharea]|uniref:RagB/SusD family nutrient uptake outer membrane protein n=1 Tax=Chitinophaga polysaccharea TaxID=1293035 RepID=UPI001455B46B|nr:RagB/SusD family nutrient uptake outer membrane protein [Chitinophaga polysaccharea]NLR62239.1 RagB/SusD family nutrient uptake outer membrane protein [Chitinophaga polysaccharea]